mgnify:CR=1 FL=1
MGKAGGGIRTSGWVAEIYVRLSAVSAQPCDLICCWVGRPQLPVFGSILLPVQLFILYSK